MATLRGTTGLAFTGASQSLTLPAGTVAGDWAILFAASRSNPNFNPTNIVAWQSLYANPISNQNCFVWTKVLTSADITAASVTVGISSSDASYAALATGSGTAMWIEGVVSNPYVGSSNVTSNSLTCPGINGDKAIYFAAQRRDGVTPTCTLSTGTLGNESAVANFAGAVRSEALSSTANKTVTASYTTAGTFDVLIFAMLSDSARSGAADTDSYFGAASTNTAYVFKGRTTASADSGSVA